MTVRAKQAKMFVAAVVLAVAAAGGCGGQRSVGGSASPSATVPPDLVKMRGTAADDAGSYELIVDGNRRFRQTLLTGPDAGAYVVWDGKVLLSFDPQSDPKYQRQDNPSQDEFPRATFFYRPGTKEFADMCAAAKRLGTTTLFARTAVRYHCDKVVTAEGSPVEPMDAREIALDEQTGLVLSSGGPDKLTEVTFGPVIAPDTFSTKMPAGGDSPAPGSGPSGPGPAKTEARLRQIATTTTTPIYYLGAEFHGLPLEDAIIFTGDTEAQGDTSLDPGQSLNVGYGSSCSEGSCSSGIEVGAEEIPLGGNIVGCSRLTPIHGVPTVSLAGDSVVLFTGPLAIRVGTTPGDVELAAQAAKELRRVGESAAAGTLPPPPASKLKLIDAACGRRPGEHGPGLYDDPALNPASDGMPAFTVPRLGGGQLRWADYDGKPVVVAAGDVTDVAPAVRRLAKLTSGGKSPTVIGLTWDTVGDKEHPAPTAEIQRKAGHLPVPVGYPATEPAVWLSDAAGIDPSQSGVIGFLDSKGIPSTFLPTDASDAEIRAALRQLH
ncbi:hypothetical protein OG558_26950 [Kribbella sp. NBC_01510]|uniref:hypothetical protein n=1 Tax=Kribbella sp. NBC_01510 TaxID=2903581 RepID=UPI00386DFB14